MEQKLIYEVTAEELKKAFTEPIREEMRAELKARYNQNLVSSEVVAALHGITPQTVRKYVDLAMIQCEPRVKTAPMRFRAGDALYFDFKRMECTLRKRK